MSVHAPATHAALYLASRSPRRHQLLRQLGVTFEELRLREAPGRRRDIVEKPRNDEDAQQYVQRIALAKASIAARRAQLRGVVLLPVLAADTEVVLDGAIFGKPADSGDAVGMLKRLAGRTHCVLTAVALCSGRQHSLSLSATNVTFRKLTDDEIKRYVASGESSDKAGGYAVQGRAAAFIARLDGSYSGVMGLPLFETAGMLAKIGMSVL
jgi:septum formation protein